MEEDCQSLEYPAGWHFEAGIHSILDKCVEFTDRSAVRRVDVVILFHLLEYLMMLD